MPIHTTNKSVLTLTVFGSKVEGVVLAERCTPLIFQEQSLLIAYRDLFAVVI